VKTFFLLALSAGLVLAQDKTITSNKGPCQVTVPANWVVGSIASMAATPDKKASAIVSSPTAIDSFAQLKTMAQKLYQEPKVVKDSATEFEMEAKSMNGKPNVYRAIASGNKYCIVEVIYESGTVADARKIAETLK
jgi:hypothetical protein